MTTAAACSAEPASGTEDPPIETRPADFVFHNGRVYTVEGNSGDMVRQSSYPIGDISIYGYGIPNY